MRIDKFLKNSRLIKRRSVAKEACDNGRICLNGRQTKAGADVKEGDEIFIQFGNSSMKVRVIKLLETCKKEEAFDMYEII